MKTNKTFLVRLETKKSGITIKLENRLIYDTSKNLYFRIHAGSKNEALNNFAITLESILRKYQTECIEKNNWINYNDQL